jgi:hypothetical protein
MKQHKKKPLQPNYKQRNWIHFFITPLSNFG